MPTANPAPPLPPPLAAPLQGGGSPALALGLLVSGILHLFLLLSLSFRMPTPAEPPAEASMEVLILKERGVAPTAPDPGAAMSQSSRAGESAQGTATRSANLDLDTLPEPVREGIETLRQTLTEERPPSPEPPPEPRQTPSPPEPREARKPPPAVQPPARDPLAVESIRPVDAAQIFASRDRQIAALTASLEARTAAYANRTRRKSVSASTREFRFASYMSAWAHKVEGIGNLNYPQAAKEQHIYGSLILGVAVRRDGSVESVRVVRSSGHEVLDRAAIRIVELAAPYSAFPPDIAADTDVLDIVRTWQFMPGGRLGWK